MSKPCNNLGLDSSDTGASGSYGDPFSVINFFMESVFCSINTPEVYEKKSFTPESNPEVAASDIKDRVMPVAGWFDIISDIKNPNNSECKENKNIYVLNFSQLDQSLFGGRPINAKEVNGPYMQQLIDFILEPCKDTRVLSIILYNDRHYTCLLHSEDNNWIYFDSYGGTKEGHYKDDQLIDFLTSGEFVCDFTLYIEKVNPPASFENTGLSEGSYKSPLKLKRTKYLSPTSKIKVARKKRKTNIQKLKVKK